jgi:sugar phosphate isomerase/epimerase
MKVIHVNVPYRMLLRRIDFSLANRIHPEIFFSADDLDECDQNDVESLAGVLQDKGIEITLHGPFMDLSPGGADRKIKEVTLDRFLKTIELARFFKPKTIVFHPGYERWKFDDNVDLWLKSSLMTWRPLVNEAAEMGLAFAIENVFEETPAPLAMLLKEIDSPHFGFCFDTGHHRVFSKVPFPVWIETLGKYLKEVHLHDNHGERDEHLPVGEGDFDFDGFFHLLRQSGLDPLLTIEPHEEEHLRRSLKAMEKYCISQGA